MASSSEKRIEADAKKAKDMGLLCVVVRRGKWYDAKKRKALNSRQGNTSSSSWLQKHYLLLAEEALRGKGISLGTT